MGHLYVPMKIGRWLLKIKKLLIVLSKSLHVKNRNNFVGYGRCDTVISLWSLVLSTPEVGICKCRKSRLIAEIMKMQHFPRVILSVHTSAIYYCISLFCSRITSDGVFISEISRKPLPQTIHCAQNYLELVVAHSLSNT